MMRKVIVTLKKGNAFELLIYNVKITTLLHSALNLLVRFMRSIYQNEIILPTNCMLI